MRQRYAAHRTTQQHEAFRAYVRSITRTVITSEIYFRPLNFAAGVFVPRRYYRMRPAVTR